MLLGDAIDFSVASYEDAYRAAKAFFVALQRDGLAREIVYVPGNHDFDIRNVVEHQVNVRSIRIGLPDALSPVEDLDPA